MASPATVSEKFIFPQQEKITNYLKTYPKTKTLDTKIIVKVAEVFKGKTMMSTGVEKMAEITIEDLKNKPSLNISIDTHMLVSIALKDCCRAHEPSQEEKVNSSSHEAPNNRSIQYLSPRSQPVDSNQMPPSLQPSQRPNRNNPTHRRGVPLIRPYRY